MSALNTTTFQNDQLTDLATTDQHSNKALNCGLSILGVLLVLLSMFESAQASNDLEHPSGNGKLKVVRLMQSNEFEAALQELDSMDETDGCTNHLLGVCYFELGMYAQAELHLTDAVEEMVDESETWIPTGYCAPIHAMFYLGKTMFAKGQYEDAEYHLSQFLVSLHMMNEDDQWLVGDTETMIKNCRSAETAGL